MQGLCDELVLPSKAVGAAEDTAPAVGQNSTSHGSSRDLLLRRIGCMKSSRYLQASTIHKVQLGRSLSLGTNLDDQLP